MNYLIYRDFFANNVILCGKYANAIRICEGNNGKNQYNMYRVFIKYVHKL